MSAHAPTRHAAGDSDGAPGAPAPVVGGQRGLDVLLAASGALLIAMRINLPVLLTVGTVLSLAFAPVWLQMVTRYVGFRWLVALGLSAICAGGVLSLFAADDHEVSLRLLLSLSFLMVNVLAGAGFLLWATSVLGLTPVVLIYGFGLLAGSVGRSEDFATNPWKFGLSAGVVLVVLGLATAARRRWLELASVLVLALVSAVFDARSLFAGLVLVAAFLAWQLRPQRQAWRASTARVLLGLLVVGGVIYNLVEALLLRGLLGTETQERSQLQVDQSGSLILGGRPEIAATIALFRSRPAGFGSATLPSYDDINVAKNGMASLNYDPNNGYVENYMFGTSYTLHSALGDLWAPFGWLGIAFAVTVTVLVVRALGRAVGTSSASALMLYVGLRWCWDFAFSPWYSTIPLLTLTLVVVLTSAGNRTPTASGPGISATSVDAVGGGDAARWRSRPGLRARQPRPDPVSASAGVGRRAAGSPS